MEKKYFYASRAHQWANEFISPTMQRRPVEPELALIVFEMQLVVKQKAYFFVERFFVEAVLFENKPAARR